MPGTNSTALTASPLTPAVIPVSHRDLLVRPVFAILSTLMPGGQPQSSLVWVDYDGTDLLINTTLERQKAKNMVADPRVTVLVVDPADTSRFIEVRGRVTSISEEGATAHADKLSQRYTGKPHFYGDIYPPQRQTQETRVIVKICPVKVTLDAFFNQPEPLSAGDTRR
ncbi:MAG: PPOX class F420-dependent oxidoreductase [Chloroflexi bacterium]|nr:PPOX class F420-dependent oxidoreductase [Chloroflexota bacterium]